MAVLIPNTSIGVRRSTIVRGAFGDRVAVPGAAGATRHLPAAKREMNDGTWRLNIDPSLWPVREKDVLVEPDGASYVVRTAENITHPEAPEISHVRCTAVQVAAQGAEPGGAEFVGRS